MSINELSLKEKKERLAATLSAPALTEEQALEVISRLRDEELGHTVVGSFLDHGSTGVN